MGSTNTDIYLPLENPELNFTANEKENLKKNNFSEDLATTAQIGKLASLLKRNNVGYSDIFQEFNIKELNELKKYEASKLIQKYSDNKPSP